MMITYASEGYFQTLLARLLVDGCPPPAILTACRHIAETGISTEDQITDWMDRRAETFKRLSGKARH